MTNSHYEDLANELLLKAKALGEKKGREYAHTETDDDRLKNFRVVKDIAQLKTEGQAILNYMIKSIMSLGYHASDPKRSMNEPVEERCIDIINYVLLYYAWASEEAHTIRDTGDLIDAFQSRPPYPTQPMSEESKAELDQRVIDGMGQDLADQLSQTKARDIYCSHGS